MENGAALPCRSDHPEWICSAHRLRSAYLIEAANRASRSPSRGAVSAQIGAAGVKLLNNGYRKRSVARPILSRVSFCVGSTRTQLIVC